MYVNYTKYYLLKSDTNSLWGYLVMEANYILYYIAYLLYIIIRVIVMLSCVFLLTSI